jgi:hypothetical protein
LFTGRSARFVQHREGRPYLSGHPPPAATFPEALRAVEGSATIADDATAPVDAQPAPVADDDWPVGRLVETIGAMGADANGDVAAYAGIGSADWGCRVRAVHRCGWSAAESWSSGEREAAAWILDDPDAMDRFGTTPADIQDRSRMGSRALPEYTVSACSPRGCSKNPAIVSGCHLEPSAGWSYVPTN